MLAQVKESTRVLNVEGDERQEVSNFRDSLNIHEAPEAPNAHSAFSIHQALYIYEVLNSHPRVTPVLGPRALGQMKEATAAHQVLSFNYGSGVTAPASLQQNKYMVWVPGIFICHHPSLAPLPCGSVLKNLPAVQEIRVRSLGWEDPLE